MLLKLALVFIFLVVLVSGIGAFWFSQQLTPIGPSGQTPQAFVIPKGQALSIIASRLVEEKLIKNEWAFRYVVWKEDLASDIQAGSFDLSPSMSIEQIALAMTKGTEDEWVTIPEGKRVEEIAELFGDFSAFDKEEFIMLAKKDEGYLFPDTYLFPRLATTETVYNVLRSTFDEKMNTEVLPTINPTEEKVKEIVTLASLVEREARHPEDMKMVAGILRNRLDIGMPLQVDATLQYVKATNARGTNWWPTPLAVDKELDSPYNTYKNAGLPPNPICNPGINALIAATEPTDSEYFYYISDNSGNMHYAVTYDEHLANVQKYLR